MSDTLIDSAAVRHLPDEVVTRSLVRDVQLPGGGTFALITLDNGRDHTRPTTFGAAGLASLDEALDTLTARAAAGEIVGVGVTGKPFFFCAGADLTMAAAGRTREDSLLAGQQGHRIFAKIGALGVPSFGFINGVALGGGLELALHCTYRTVNSTAPAIGLPEVFLGLIPGWGGAYLLPNLIGPAAALQVIVENPLNNGRTINGRAAFSLGLADALFESAEFLEASLLWAGEVIAGRVEVSRPAIDRDQATWDAAVADARELADEKLNGGAPAPYIALDLIAAARTADRAAGFAAEDEALADLGISPEFRSGLYSFDLVNKRAKRPAGAPDPKLARKITSVGVVGAGLMAGQLALLFARRLEVPVVLTDLDQARVDAGVAGVHSSIDSLLRKKRISPDAANRFKALVTGSTDKAAFAEADLVIEAVFERLDVKKQVLAEVEAVVSDECVLMTNTSSLSISAMAADLAHPERVVGFHFFNPVAVMPLIEVVRAEQTDDITLATAFAVGKQLKKTCVLVKDAPAFVVNRLLTRFMGEVNRAVDEGTDPEIADGALAPLGLPMTPFTLLQLVGPAIALHTSQTMNEAFPDRFGVSTFLSRLVEQGVKNLWAIDADGQMVVADDVRALLPSGLSSGLSSGDGDLAAEQVRDRALSAMAQEIRLMLDEGVVAAPQDIDLCLIMGAGWPFHLGGITPYLDRAGVSERVTGRRFLPPGVASLPA